MLKHKLLIALAAGVAFAGATQASDETIRKAMLGVAIAPAAAHASAMDNVIDIQGGVQIVSVTGGSPAERAGVQAGDVVLKMNGEPVASMRDLLAHVSRSTLGDSFRLIVMRGGQERVVDGIFDAWEPRCHRKRRMDNSTE